MKVRVLHEYYSCDTGCCGHIVEVETPDGWQQKGMFNFGHPSKNGDFKQFALDFLVEEFGADHCMDLDWESSEVVYD